MNSFRNSALIAFLIFIINFGFKYIDLTVEPIWYDECFSIFYSQQSIADILFVSTWEPPPPLFHLGLHYWIKVFGISEFGVRLLPLLISSIAAPVLYLFLQKFTSYRVAITASVLYLFSDISFYYAHEVRCYSFVLLTSIVSMWLFIELLSKPRLIIAVCLGLSYYILIMTHYLTFFILLFQGVVFLLFINRRFFVHYLITVISFLFLIKHWIPRMVEVAQGNTNNQWMTSPDKDTLIAFLYNINNGYVQFMLVFVLAIIGLISVWIKKTPFLPSREVKAIFAYAICISIVTTLLSFFISASIPMFLDRYLLFTLIGFIILFSVCISHLPIKNSYYYVVIAIIGAYAVSQVKINVPTQKMDYRSAVAYVKQHEDSTSAIFIQTIDVTALFTYYYDRSIFKDYPNTDQNRIAKKIFQGNDSTQLAKVMNDSFPKIIHVETYSEFTDPNHTVEAWFSKHGYKKITEENSFNQVRIGVYQK